jgi:hypothetical protein
MEALRRGRIASVTELTPNSVRNIIGVPASEQEIDALIAWYEALARAAAEFPEAELKDVEPPLRSTPGPGR